MMSYSDLSIISLTESERIHWKTFLSARSILIVGHRIFEKYQDGRQGTLSFYNVMLKPEVAFAKPVTWMPTMIDITAVRQKLTKENVHGVHVPITGSVMVSNVALGED